MPDNGEDRATRARAFWSGTISFGLVSIPVNLFPAYRHAGASLRMLDEDGVPLARRYYDPETGRAIPGDSLVRGYEIADDEYVVVSDRELEAVEPEKTRDIDLRVFVDRDAIDPLHFERAYFLTPAGGSSKAYRLLAATMERTNRAGIATFVMRTREYLVAILADNGILRAETLRFHDEIRSVDEMGLPDAPEVDAKRVRAMRKAIRARTEEALDPDELSDDYAERLRALVEEKRSRGEDVVRPAGAGARAEAGTNVIDLMEVLKRSLGVEEDADDGPRRPRRSPSPDLESLTRAELYERAKSEDIAGRSGMTKAELISALRKSA